MLETETHDRYRRELAAMLNNAGKDDPEHFAAVVDLLDWAQGAGLRRAAQRLRAQGYSATDIGRALGVSRSAVAQRFPAKGRPSEPEMPTAASIGRRTPEQISRLGTEVDEVESA